MANDRGTKLILFLIALGLFLNAAALFYDTLVPDAYASGDNRMYIEGGKLEVTVKGGYGPLPISIERTVPISVKDTLEVQGSGSSFYPLHVVVDNK